MASIITDTVDFWGKKNGVQMNKEEARQAINNITGFFQILNEWDQNANSIELSGKETTLKYSSKGE